MLGRLWPNKSDEAGLIHITSICQPSLGWVNGG